MTAADHSMDLCECGDYRLQHNPDGRCCFNRPDGIGHGAAPDCYAFRLFRRHGATHLRTDDEAT